MNRKIDDVIRSPFSIQEEEKRRQIEQEVNKRVQEIVEQRWSDELKKRETDIEQEVQRRLLEAKRIMERELMADFEKQKQLEYKRILEKEVKNKHLINKYIIARIKKKLFG